MLKEMRSLAAADKKETFQVRSPEGEGGGTMTVRLM